MHFVKSIEIKRKICKSTEFHRRLDCCLPNDGCEIRHVWWVRWKEFDDRFVIAAWINCEKLLVFDVEVPGLENAFVRTFVKNLGVRLHLVDEALQQDVSCWAGHEAAVVNDRALVKLPEDFSRLDKWCYLDLSRWGWKFKNFCDILNIFEWFRRPKPFIIKNNSQTWPLLAVKVWTTYRAHQLGSIRTNQAWPNLWSRLQSNSGSWTCEFPLFHLF